MTTMFPIPVAETNDTVTLRRADYEALIGALEDVQDRAAVTEVDRATAAGETEFLPLEM